MHLSKNLTLITLLLFITTASFGGGLYTHIDKIWTFLLHYKDGKSNIDYPGFFLHPEGRYSPYKELSATIDAFEEDPSLMCIFPARAYFLKKLLGIDLPKVECPDLEKFLSYVDGTRISIVFADAHINSPASMFGHTFLRIYNKENDLFSFIVNYAAEATDTNGLIYAFKGVFGFYEGKYSVAPFYLKIKEYTAFEGRDLWEYEIDADPEMVYLFKLHLWEIKNAYVYYYFFQENCSTEVFYLARMTIPDREVDLSTPWTIPADTVKVLIREGVIKRYSYQPSILTEIKHIAKRLDRKDIEEIEDWVDGKEDLPEGKRKEFYDFAYLYVRFLFYGEALERDRYRKLYLQALRERSKLGKSEVKKPKRDDPPHLSHDSQRFGVAFGYEDRRPYLDMGYRPAYHDLLDPPKGYKKNSQIEFSSLWIRYFPAEGKVRLKRWRLLSIVSLDRIETFYRPPSWRVNLSLERRLTYRRVKRNFLLFKSSGGYTVGTPLGDVFLMASLRGLSDLRENAIVAGGGLEGGYLLQGRRVSLLINPSAGKYIYGFGSKVYVDVSAGIGFHIATNLSLRAEGEYSAVGNANSSEAKVSLLLYF